MTKSELVDGFLVVLRDIEYPLMVMFDFLNKKKYLVNIHENIKWSLDGWDEDLKNIVGDPYEEFQDMDYDIVEVYGQPQNNNAGLYDLKNRKLLWKRNTEKEKTTYYKQPITYLRAELGGFIENTSDIKYFCNNCNSPIKKITNFCPVCGAKILKIVSTKGDEKVGSIS